MIRMITIVPKDKAQEFITSGRLGNYNTLPQVSREALSIVKEYIHKHVGYDNLPIACLSRAEGTEVSLEEIGSEINDYIPVSSSTILFEMQMPEDMIVSISFEDLLSLSNQLKNCQEDWEKEMLVEQFNEKMSTGGMDGGNIISFIPFIDLKRCKFFSVLNENWEMGNLKIPGLREVKLNNLTIF